ncbi:MAG: M13 family metallopeptidase [Bacteroidia bacterium]|nr:M13 family metallopeptidase [Bacteroidia bacterium]NND09635.1 M13 family metallopeptidase [Flavobacteriaceae bacterium]MBT8310312.1 M13 family metallopeptidase [Bacteroidia bacterium]NNK28715.1 M13 family metallopeptidase [Flavobacteriaceae bacterium]NNL60191.1 M13 family metallopeptidase [Flavobacteriaceae bacterium]
MKTTLKKSLLLGSAVLIGLISCKKDSDKEIAEKIPGIVLENMDTTVSPKDDFYSYVNGNWVKTTTIPEEESRWGGFNVLRKSTRNDVLSIVKTAKELGSYDEGTDQKKALLLFESELDTVARDAAGLEPLKPLLSAIDGISNLTEMQSVYAKTIGVDSPFYGFQVFPDLNNSAMNASYISQGSLGLPDRDYYVLKDDKSKERRQQYVDHITRMMQYIDYSESDAKAAAEMILAVETRLAEPQLDKAQQRNISNFNNPRTLEQLSEITPAVDWKKFIKDLGVEKDIDTVYVLELKYMDELQKVLTTTPIEDIKTMMKWSTLNNAANLLTTELEKANWDFYSKTLRGTETQRPREDTAMDHVTGRVGEAIGKLYVDAKFPPEAKAKAEKMIANVITAFKARIDKLDWMSADTKAKAIEKLDKFTVKIAYPDEWEDYSELQIKEGNGYAENMLALSEWNQKENLSEIGQPVDKSEWGMPPQMVNAYFNPFNNEIVFPAAILQPPFYNYTADEAVNYGGIGAVIGHEISHAFDDQGAQFDSDGNLVNWWTPEDLAEFKKRGKALADQYSSIEVLDSLYINGTFTLGENIGDLGGVLGAYDGLQLHFKENGRPDDIDGFTAEQRFFMSWATVWRTLTRDDAMETQIKTDPHSPGIYRAIQPLKNIDAFYEAFGIKEGDNMYLPEDQRVRIW